ncbi:MAG: MBOAT family protein [Lawsonibacter sp.]|nr:MBOAT family protein [Lawsonibacter sp.]
MVFSSPIFLFFFLPVVYLVCRLLPGVRSRNLWLTLASLVFYSFGQPLYLLLLLASVLLNYLFGLGLMTALKGRGWLLAGVVTGNLLLLGTFKYLDFLLHSLNHLLGLTLPLPGIVLPIGISFYTFQGLSYAIDVYRDPKAGTRSFPKLVLYISFFPQLIAGPIVKYHDVSAQIDRRDFTPELTLMGLRRFIVGLGKKLLLANTAGQVADAVFAMTAGELDLRLAWLGAVCYTLQIYFDFSGYSDMAIGLGGLFGFRFLENFNLPYTARSIKEFWRRWHISLSSWFRDYLYIPLGGNRNGTVRTWRNKLIVFFTTGLWHGANWTFVLWGLWHGLFSALEDMNLIPKRLHQSVLGQVYTLLVVILGFTLFRASSLAEAWRMFRAMFTGLNFTPAHTLALIGLLDGYTVFFLSVAALLALGLPQRLAERLHPVSLPLWDGARTGACAGLFLLCVLTLSNATFNPFIYFQF